VRRSTIDDRRFVDHWQRARSIGAVARAFGLTTQQASNHATWLRHRGVPLRTFRSRFHGRVSTAELTRIAQGVAGGVA